jgi:transcription elongation factor GreA
MTGETYLTSTGAIKFREELHRLKGPVREALSARLRAAIQQGDLSENADYTSAKEEQAFVEGRILELETMLKDIIIIDNLPRNEEKVQIGSKVTLQEKGGELETYVLVGPHEANPFNGMISYESPIGQALLNHRKGEKIKFSTPQGEMELLIVTIE